MRAFRGLAQAKIAKSSAAGQHRPIVHCEISFGVHDCATVSVWSTDARADRPLVVTLALPGLQVYDRALAFRIELSCRDGFLLVVLISLPHLPAEIMGFFPSPKADIFPRAHTF